MTNPDDDKIVKVVDLNAPIARAWQALTDYREFGNWFRVDLDQPFEAGGKSTGRMTYPGHEDVVWYADIENLQPERLFSFFWYDSDDSATGEASKPIAIRVAFELEKISNGTRLTITESGFSTLQEARRKQLLEDNAEGWNIQVDNLRRYLSGST